MTLSVILVIMSGGGRVMSRAGGLLSLLPLFPLYRPYPHNCYILLHSIAQSHLYPPTKSCHHCILLLNPLRLHPPNLSRQPNRYECSGFQSYEVAISDPSDTACLSTPDPLPEDEIDCHMEVRTLSPGFVKVELMNGLESLPR